MGNETPEIPYRRIGTILVEWGLIGDHDLTEALSVQEESGRLLGEILVSNYGVSRMDLADALSEQWQEANRAATHAIEAAAATLSPLEADVPAQAVADGLVEADLRVLLDEAEAARAELTLRTEELSRRLATLETLVVGVTEALDELRTSGVTEAATGGRAATPGDSRSRRTRSRAGARPSTGKPAH